MATVKITSFAMGIGPITGFSPTTTLISPHWPNLVKEGPGAAALRAAVPQFLYAHARPLGTRGVPTSVVELLVVLVKGSSQCGAGETPTEFFDYSDRWWVTRC